MTTRMLEWSYDHLTIDADGAHYRIELGHDVNPSRKYVTRVRERLWPLGNGPKTLTQELLPHVLTISRQKGHAYEEMATITFYPGWINLQPEVYRNGVVTNEMELISVYNLLCSLLPDHKGIEEIQGAKELQAVDPWFIQHVDPWLISHGLKAIELLRELEEPNKELNQDGGSQKSLIFE